MLCANKYETIWSAYHACRCMTLLSGRLLVAFAESNYTRGVHRQRLWLELTSKSKSNVIESYGHKTSGAVRRPWYTEQRKEAVDMNTVP